MVKSELPKPKAAQEKGTSPLGFLWTRLGCAGLGLPLVTCHQDCLRKLWFLQPVLAPEVQWLLKFLIIEDKPQEGPFSRLNGKVVLGNSTETKNDSQ